MGVPQSPPNIPTDHLYSHALQLKLYEAFIFSIPILFSIILFLLFYLFYLKRRAFSLSSSSPQVLPSYINYATPFVPMSCEMGLKGELNNKLPKVLFDEDLKARDSLCCVCLGEFEMKEELIQVRACKHVFHVDCIHHWLQSNSTCPLCRCPVLLLVGPPSIQPNLYHQEEAHLGGDDHGSTVLTEGTSSTAESTTLTTSGLSVIHIQTNSP